MPAKKVWTRERITYAMNDAVAADAYMNPDERAALRNAWPSTCSTNYDWLHRLTEDAMPIVGIGHEVPDRHNLDILMEVAVRWLEWLPSITDRKIIWLVYANMEKTKIAKIVDMKYRTLMYHIDDIENTILENLLEKDSEIDPDSV
ncbi:MAG: hypothetical protein LBL75_02830 [Rickettsiales bacterium]|jgi:hypothetical protein|nr:hypothetical protein [Rickettsiales bacterium]